jgi:hypothetical protein
MLSVANKSIYAECRYAECRYAESHGTLKISSLYKFKFAYLSKY